MPACLLGYLVSGPQEIVKTKEEIDTWITEHVDENSQIVCEPDPFDDYCRARVFCRIDLEKLFADFIDRWHKDDADDVASRHDLIPNRKVMFTGDYSWGDEPDGITYQLLSKIFLVKADKFFDLN